MLEAVHEILERRDYRIAPAHRTEQWGDTTSSYTRDTIVIRDIGWLDDCSAVVAVLSTTEQAIFRSDGTFIELGYAIVMRKPIVFLLDGIT